jgi:hypothetical protein
MDPAGDDQLDNSGWRAFISKSGASARGRLNLKIVLEPLA